jgi:predicted nucleic acid-binding protein
MRIYLDNCCFNRPFDNQSSIRVKLETDAKLFVQLKIKEGKIDLVWSYILDFENGANPFSERKSTIDKWRRLSDTDIVENMDILSKADELAKNGLKPKDALHIACAVDAKCDYFLTTDDQLLKKMANNSDIPVLNPTDFIKIIEEL